MSKHIVDLTGQRFGTWTVLGLADSYYTSASIDYRTGEIRKHIQTRYVCRCDCGNVSTVLASNLRSGQSTGCYECRNKKISAYMKRLHRFASQMRTMFPEEYADA